MDKIKIYIIYDEIAEDIITHFIGKNDRYAILKTTEIIKKNAPSVDFEITLYQVSGVNEDGTILFNKIIEQFDSEKFFSNKEN